MHIMIMHNSMLLDFSVVLIRITLLFSELGVLPQTLEPRRIERPFLPQASSFLHILIELFYKNYFQKHIIIIALKKKNYFRMMWIAIYILFGWQWNHGLMLWWRFHCTGKYIPRINYQCHSDPCAVLKRLPWDLLWTVKVSRIFSRSHILGRLLPGCVRCGGQLRGSAWPSHSTEWLE